MNQDNPDLDELASIEGSYSPRPHALIVINPLQRARVEKAYAALGLPAPYVARNRVEGGQQARDFLYDIVISDIKAISDLAQRAGVAVESNPKRGHIDVGSPDLAGKLRDAVYSKYHKVLILEAERSREYKNNFQGAASTVVARSLEEAHSSLREGQVDLVVIGRGVEYSSSNSIGYGMKLAKHTHLMHPGTPVLLETSHPEYMRLISSKAKGYGATVMERDPQKVAEAAKEILKARKPKELDVDYEQQTTRPFSAEAEAKGHAEHGHSEAVLVAEEASSGAECPEAELVEVVEKTAN